MVSAIAVAQKVRELLEKFNLVDKHDQVVLLRHLSVEDAVRLLDQVESPEEKVAMLGILAGIAHVLVKPHTGKAQKLVNAAVRELSRITSMTLATKRIITRDDIARIEGEYILTRYELGDKNYYRLAKILMHVDVDDDIYFTVYKVIGDVPAYVLEDVPSHLWIKAVRYLVDDRFDESEISRELLEHIYLHAYPDDLLEYAPDLLEKQMFEVLTDLEKKSFAREYYVSSDLLVLLSLALSSETWVLDKLAELSKTSEVAAALIGLGLERCERADENARKVLDEVYRRWPALKEARDKAEERLRQVLKSKVAEIAKTVVNEIGKAVKQVHSTLKPYIAAKTDVDVVTDMTFGYYARMRVTLGVDFTRRLPRHVFSQVVSMLRQMGFKFDPEYKMWYCKIEIELDDEGLFVKACAER